MCLNALKCIQIYIPQKGQKSPKRAKNAKKWPKIANNFKISEITKYREIMTTIDQHVNKRKQMPKTSQTRKKMAKFKTKMLSFFWLETTSKNGTSRFHTMFGSRDIHFRSFF